MTSFNETVTATTITVTEGYSMKDTLKANITENGELGEITEITFGFDGYAPMTLEEANELKKAPISQEFPTGTPETASAHTVIGLIDRARFVLEKQKFGKANCFADRHPESGRLFLNIIKVGTAGHYGSWTDRHPCVVTKVSPSGKQLTVEDVRATPAEDFDYYMNQVYNFDPTPIGNAQKVYKGKYGYKNGSLKFNFGSFHKYEDPQF